VHERILGGEQLKEQGIGIFHKRLTVDHHCREQIQTQIDASACHHLQAGRPTTRQRRERFTRSASGPMVPGIARHRENATSDDARGQDGALWLPLAPSASNLCSKTVRSAANVMRAPSLRCYHPPILGTASGRLGASVRLYQDRGQWQARS